MTSPFSSTERQNPAKAINRVAKLVTRYFDRKPAGAGMSIASPGVLGPLREVQPMPLKDPASSTGSSQAAIAELLSKMVRDGLLSREQDIRDRRQVLFSLTETGISLLAQVHNIILDGNAELFGVLGDNGREDLLSRLAQVEERLGEL